MKILKILKILSTGFIGLWLFYLVGYGGTLDNTEIALLGIFLISLAVDETTKGS